MAREWNGRPDRIGPCNISTTNVLPSDITSHSRTIKSSNGNVNSFRPSSLHNVTKSSYGSRSNGFYWSSIFFVCNYVTNFWWHHDHGTRSFEQRQPNGYVLLLLLFV